MKNPIISFEEERLVLRFPDWEQKQVAAIQDMMICWQRRGTMLFSEPVLLAYREAKDTLSKLEEHKSSIEMFLEDRTPLRIESEKVGLLGFQKTPVSLLEQRSKALLTAAPGLGKTVMLAAAASEERPQVLVVCCPSSLADNWKVELNKWWLVEEKMNPGKVKCEIWREVPPEPPNWSSYDHWAVILHPELLVSLRKKLLLEKYFQGIDDKWEIQSSTLIVDESYLFKNRKSARSKALYQIAPFFKTCWMDSGMPISKFSDDLFSQLNILYPKTFRSYWKFAERYCLLQTTHWGTSIVGNKKSIEELKDDLQDILIECEYPKEIPDWIPETLEVSLTERQEKIYLDLRDKLKVEAETLGSDTPLTLKTLITLTGRLTQAVNNPALLGGVDESSKEDLLLELLESKPLPALIWINYLSTAASLQAKLKKMSWIRCETLTGRTPSAERQQVVDRFQNGETNTLILNPAVGKYGHTLTAVRTAYYLQMNFDREGHHQSLFRGRRIISEHPVNLVYFLATMRDGKQTIDKVIYNHLIDSSRKAQTLTAGKLIGSL